MSPAVPLEFSDENTIVYSFASQTLFMTGVRMSAAQKSIAEETPAGDSGSFKVGKAGRDEGFGE